MKSVIIWSLSFSIIVVLHQCNHEECTCPEHECPETDLVIPDVIVPDQEEPIPQPLDGIIEVLRNHPPNNGDPMTREHAIMMLDAYLSIETTRDSTNLFEFYDAMMQKVSMEIEEQVNGGIRIWMMYNHGFVIKTPLLTFAFDLIDGYQGWQSYRNYELPENIINNIDVLLISHEHKDHTDKSIIEKIYNQGGTVINSSKQSTVETNGLIINIHPGLHIVETQIFEVITPKGYKIIHTGDNQTSEALPYVDDVDVLLVNAWVNESGTTYSTQGMKNCMYKLEPTLMIPGHIHELYHDVDGRPKYKWSFYIDDGTLPCHFQVMAWGEHFDFFK